MEDAKSEKILANAIICVFLSNIDISILETLFAYIFAILKNETPLKMRFTVCGAQT